MLLIVLVVTSTGSTKCPARTTVLRNVLVLRDGHVVDPVDVTTRTMSKLRNRERIVILRKLRSLQVGGGNGRLDEFRNAGVGIVAASKHHWKQSYRLPGREANYRDKKESSSWLTKGFLCLLRLGSDPPEWALNTIVVRCVLFSMIISPSPFVISFLVSESLISVGGLDILLNGSFSWPFVLFHNK